ncbi:MAG: ribbon-helix-helix domain-containing protein [Candidatus Woesearchaeota archaeon]|nr:ribbon-helix-helix domain-containing protein [Candidatus Woesearchaeota archaeon]
METVSLKLEHELLDEIDTSLVKNRYGTRTEFIRDAIREKLSDLEKQELLRAIAFARGVSKRKTSDNTLHKAREEIFNSLEK